MQEVTRGILMKVRYIGNKGSNLSVIKGHIYQCLGEENGYWYRVIDEEGEDYLYPKKDFEIVED
ncbi:hypothetical protein [Bullifex sp.]|uniref:hypothetical protein n=1 Tax=Bullifex sp. TaxID=2815808 RepID=UPI002A838C7E|nr:hypothetical protein [Bullifex sp.]MDY4066666.1 hypothetical protein [Bullifex sp.]